MVGGSPLIVGGGSSLAELAGEGLTEAMVLGSQFGCVGAKGLELLAEGVGGGVLGNRSGGMGGG